MYSNEIISTLTERIGFGTPNEEGFSININEANSVGASGRLFSSFHSLVTTENIYAAVENPEIKEDEFNVILENYRKSSVLEVVPLIMDKNIKYNNSLDYSKVIEDNIRLFDDAIGYKVAMMVLEMFMSSSRSNLLERNAKFSLSNLKLELEGYRNEASVLVAKGLVQKFERAVLNATNKIFPRVVEVRNATNEW